MVAHVSDDGQRTSCRSIFPNPGMHCGCWKCEDCVRDILKPKWSEHLSLVFLAHASPLYSASVKQSQRHRMHMRTHRAGAMFATIKVSNRLRYYCTEQVDDSTKIKSVGDAIEMMLGDIASIPVGAFHPVSTSQEWSLPKRDEPPRNRPKRSRKTFGIPKASWASINSGAASRGLEMLIDREFLRELFDKQNGLCSLTGEPLTFKGESHDKTTASLDRIDSSRGYVPDNVQWVHREVNIMKLDHEQSKFIELCRKVARHADRN